MLRESVLIECAPLAGHENEVRELFRDTLVMGRRLDATIACTREYEKVNLGWFLSHGTHDSVVVLSRGEVVGYGLVCIDVHGLDRWVARKTGRLLGALVVSFLTFRINRDTARFYWLRARDAMSIAGSRRVVSASAPHVHMNIREGHRSGRVALELLAAVDAACRRHGASEWTGEINAVGNGRRQALERVVGRVVDSRRNRTLSWMTGTDVNRLTVVRSLPTPR